MTLSRLLSALITLIGLLVAVHNLAARVLFNFILIHIVLLV